MPHGVPIRRLPSRSHAAVYSPSRGPLEQDLHDGVTTFGGKPFTNQEWLSATSDGPASTTRTAGPNRGASMFKNRGKQLLTLSPDARHDGRNRLKLAGFARRVQDVSERITEKFDPDPVAQFRWVPWVLALLVILCLLLAAWVWFEILHT